MPLLLYFITFFANTILMKITKKNILTAVCGMGVGLINGLLGAGGGMIAVPMLKAAGLEQKQAHANAVALIMPISIVSAVTYILKGAVTVSDAVPYLLPGMAGAALGTLVLSKISSPLLRKIFALFMIWAGVRLLTR